MFTPEYPEEEVISVGKLMEILSELDKSQLIKVNSNQKLSVYSSMAFETGGKALGQIQLGEEKYEPITVYIGEF